MGGQMINQPETGAWVFDFDGTLVDSAPGILAVYGTVLQEAGLTPAFPLETSLIGPPLQETLMRISGCTDADVIQHLTERFQRHYDTAGVLATGAYPGVDAMLDKLAAAGRPMHISTNKRLSVTLAMIEHLGWQPHFISVYALDMGQPRLPGKAQLLSKQLAEQGLEAARTCYVGDKREDGLAAQANHLTFHYASWGYGDLQQEQLIPGWYWLDEPANLPPRCLVDCA